MRRLRGDDGAYAILYGITIVLVLAFAGIVVDINSARADRRLNRSAADSAALAAATQLRSDILKPKEACKTAIAYLSDNIRGVSLGTSFCDPFPASGTPCPDPTIVPPIAATDQSGAFRVTMTWPVADDSPLLEKPDVRPGNTLQSLDADFDGTRCQRFAVSVMQERDFLFGPAIGGPTGINTGASSVGRAAPDGVADPVAVALVLLERQGCDVLSLDGVNAEVVVRGRDAAPGFIHSDSIASPSDASCSRPLFYTQQDPDTPDPARIMAGHAATAVSPALRAPGVISAVALTGIAGAGATNIYSGAAGLRVRAQTDPLANVPQANQIPTPRGSVTRGPVDARYLVPVRKLIAEATASWDAPPTGFTPLNRCNFGDGTTSGTRIFVRCNNVNGVRISGNHIFDSPDAEIIFDNDVSFQGSSSSLNLQDASKVIIRGGLDANNSLSINGGASPTTCSARPLANQNRRTVLVIRDSLAFSGDPVRLCGTSVILASCAPPLTLGTAPSNRPECTNTVSSNGGGIDWSAPNATSGPPTDSDLDKLEDLALWSESAEPSGLGGNTDVRLSGVFFLPNVDPFSVGGTGLQEVENSQYVVRRLRVGGSGEFALRPNPADIVPIPFFGGISLIR